MRDALHPSALMPALRAEMADDEDALERLHNDLLNAHGAEAVARAWTAVFVAACDEAASLPEEAAASAVDLRSRMYREMLETLRHHGHDTGVEAAAVLVVAADPDPASWPGALVARGLSAADAAWGLSRLALAAANTLAVLLEGKGSWRLPEDHVAATDEREAARDDALARIARRCGASASA